MWPDFTLLSDSELMAELGDDGHKWAAAFMQVVKKNNLEIDEGLMIGWFCNAIETSYDKRLRQYD